ncbi:hypothetical protein JCM11641_005238 [Rhodosporidiobolus odoratus]
MTQVYEKYLYPSLLSTVEGPKIATAGFVFAVLLIDFFLAAFDATFCSTGYYRNLSFRSLAKVHLGAYCTIYHDLLLSLYSLNPPAGSFPLILFTLLTPP